MSSQDQVQQFLQLAHRYEQAGQSRQRDRCLELALDVAWQAGRIGDAERLWQRLRRLNPHRYLCGFRSLQEAMQSSEVKSYLANIRSQSEELLSRAPNASGSANSVTLSSGTQTSGELVLPLDTSLMRDSGELQSDVSSLPSLGMENSPKPVLRSSASLVSGGHPREPTSTAPVTSPPVPASPSPITRPPGIRSASPQMPSNRTEPSGPGADTSTITSPDNISPWVAGSLAILLVLLGLVLLGYILLAPFWPG